MTTTGIHIVIPQGLANELLDLAGLTPIVLNEDTGDALYSVPLYGNLTLEEALPLALQFIADHCELA